MASKIHTTNYFDTFIEVAEDCPVKESEIPNKAGTVADLQYKMLHSAPHKYTSDDVLFSVYAKRMEIPKNKWKEEREKFFSRGQPCFRSSPLTKRYGWGILSNSEGKIALLPMESKEYKKLRENKKPKHLKAMRSSRIYKT